MNCEICKDRRPRRVCPGVRGTICSLCCGSEREVSVDCPLDCEYLLEARAHERRAPVDPETLPNRDIRLTESFLREREPLVLFVGRKLLDATLETSGAVDADVREALESMIRTCRTLESGLVYESRPANLVAAAIQQRLGKSLEHFQSRLREQLGMETLRDADILGVLAFLQRLEIENNNGRKRGRAFVSFLNSSFPPVNDGEDSSAALSPDSSSLIVPGIR